MKKSTDLPLGWVESLDEIQSIKGISWVRHFQEVTINYHLKINIFFLPVSMAILNEIYFANTLARFVQCGISEIGV